MPIRVLIADDHGVVRQGLRMFLEADPELEIVGEARDGAEALRLAQSLRPDVVLMDLLMPVMDGLQATAAIRASLPDTDVIALTSVLEYATVAQAVSAGAAGYLLKDTSAHELRRAIKSTAAGQIQLSPKVAAQLLGQVPAPPPISPDALTPRETEVLRLLALGHSNKDIGRRLSIVEETVKSHVARILSKLRVASRTQAALYAVHHGLVSSTGPGSPPAA
jgi:DNA-binding NarL/FixJ family response regulator